MSKVIIFQPELHRQRARLKSVAGARQSVENQYQGPRILRQFLGGSSPLQVARRERLETATVVSIIREKLAEHVFGEAA